MRRALLLPLLAVAVVLALAGPAAAGPILDEAARNLLRDPVYVAPDADPSITAAEADRLRARIRDLPAPLYIAILPSSAAREAGGNVSRLPEALFREMNLRGTYAVAAGRSLRAGSNALPSGSASAAATQAVQQRSSDDLFDILDGFVSRIASVQPTAAGRGGGEVVEPSREPRSDEGSDNLLPVLALAGVGGAGYLWVRKRRQRAQYEQDLVGARESLRPELQVLADDVIALEPEVITKPEARADYDAAVSRYRAALAAIDQARTPDDIDRLERVLEEGRYAMSRARARVEGREPPAPPEPLRVPGRHNEPAIDLDERHEPVYVGYPGGGFYGGGWFSGGGLLTGLMLGQMFGGLGGGMFGGGYGRGYEEGYEDGDRRGGWGDGGGDWGGGDFGGGDFGGDVGGGDW